MWLVKSIYTFSSYLLEVPENRRKKDTRPEALLMNNQLEDEEDDDIEINRGEWTKSEVKQLLNNVSFYLSKNKLPLIQLLQPISGNVGLKKWDELSYDIWRPLSSVRAKVNSLFGKCLPKGAGAYREPVTRRSQFSEDENNLLLKAVKDMNVYDENGKPDEDKINWHAVALRVQTRTASSCRQRWKIYLSDTRPSDDIVQHWGRKDCHAVCRHVCDYVEKNNVHHFEDISWQAIKTSSHVPKPENQIKKKFNSFLNYRKMSCSKSPPLQRKVKKLLSEKPLEAIDTSIPRWKKPVTSE